MTKQPDVVVRGTPRAFDRKSLLVSIDFSLTNRQRRWRRCRPWPIRYLLTALGVCTSMTIGFTRAGKNCRSRTLRSRSGQSRIYANDCEECETKEGMLDRIDVEVELTGPLSAEQRAKLMEIAEKCPVHRTLTSEINIRLRAAQKESAA